MNEAGTGTGSGTRSDEEGHNGTGTGCGFFYTKYVPSYGPLRKVDGTDVTLEDRLNTVDPMTNAS